MLHINSIVSKPKLIKRRLPEMAVLLMLCNFFLYSPSQPKAWAQVAGEPTFDLQLVDLYAELQPEKYMLNAIAVLYFTCDGSEPVVFRCQGNIYRLEIYDKSRPNLAWHYNPPYISLENFEAGAHEIEIRYSARHDGFSPGGGIVATNKINLDASSFWYPRQNASDAHQVVLNLESPANYEISANAELKRDVPNNGKRLRTWILADPLPEGITLESPQSR